MYVCACMHAYECIYDCICMHAGICNVCLCMYACRGACKISGTICAIFQKQKYRHLDVISEILFIVPEHCDWKNAPFSPCDEDTSGTCYLSTQ